MARLIYSVISSLDGYIEDAGGGFDWAVPDDEVHTFINELERRAGTYLYGRRMYEVMVGWEDESAFADQPAPMQEFAAIWKGVDKVVYSRSLENVLTSRTRIAREFEPADVREMKAQLTGDISIGGPDLASHAINAGLVDEYHLFLMPVAVGSGKPGLPCKERLDLELLEERRFQMGAVYLRFRQRSA